MLLIDLAGWIFTIFVALLSYDLLKYCIFRPDGALQRVVGRQGKQFTFVTLNTSK